MGSELENKIKMSYPLFNKRLNYGKQVHLGILDG
jgi:hypothetical protein